MRQMHDKLASDIETLKGRRAMGSFLRIEDKADSMLDETNAMSELNQEPVDEAKPLEEKYSSEGSTAVEDELNRLKSDMGL
ncbi:hypothetical protein JHE06_00185 [Carnobacterium sp. CS13]|uniref:PspA/IM30 family protein n=1 Tax=Carnobacterium sp. CS13 TaxID=2800128 RepID=UPI0019142497|nr:hypothetical protein [Carnobacterium sp. CS13]QQP70319.1 hypothetical protein JHE06_00185 [Carnobacterium sp. CS13]